MNNKVDVSFIVPAFNVENYIEECILSIIKQKGIKKEIIVVDDGSTDETLSVIEKLASKYTEIIVLEQSNRGVSAARNSGLEISTGEYICFVDSDDYFNGSDKLETLYRKSKGNNLDIIRGYYSVYDEETGLYIDCKPPILSYEKMVLSGRNFLRKSIQEHHNEVVPWLGLYRKTFLQENDILFPEGISYEEDQLFFLKCLIGNEDAQIMQSDELFYVYRKRKGSATKSPTVKQAYDVLEVVQREYELLQNNIISQEDTIYAKRFICSSFYQLTSIYGRIPTTDRKELTKKIPFKIMWQCIKNPYDKHQFIKIFIFAFARWVVDLVYAIRFQGEKSE